ATGPGHLGSNGLSGEEMMPQVDGLVIVPVGGGDIDELVPAIVGGVVDEYTDRTQGLRRKSDRFSKRRDVADVAAPIADRRADLCRERMRRVVGDVDERDERSLARKAPNEGSPDPRPAAGHEDRAAGKIGVARAVAAHGHDSVLLVIPRSKSL